MRVASFLLPIVHSRGERYDISHQEARGWLLRTFGGYTASNVRGAWKAPDGTTCYDNSVRYEIAADWTEKQKDELYCIATDAGFLARQQCVYLVWEDGTVELLDCKLRERDSMGAPLDGGPNDDLIQREPAAGDT